MDKELTTTLLRAKAQRDRERRERRQVPAVPLDVPTTPLPVQPSSMPSASGGGEVDPHILPSSPLQDAPNYRISSTGSLQVERDGVVFSVREAVRVCPADDLAARAKGAHYSHLHLAEHQAVKKRIHFRDLVIPDDDHLAGQGSQAVVKKVLHQPTHTHFALKIINTHGASKKELYIELERVMASSTDRDCPHLVTSYEAFFRDGRLHVLMEWMEHGSLADLLRLGGPLPEAAAAVLASHGLRGLHTLHAQRLIHRDIKPSNLLINAQGVVKIADFGVATFANTCNLANSSIGTRLFMSPERIAMTDYGFPSDVWSFGLCVAQSVLGYFPFPGCDNLFNFAVAIAHGTAQLQFPEAPPTTPALRDFVACCTRHRPQDRATPTELLRHPFLTQHPDLDSQSLLPFLPNPVSTPPEVFCPDPPDLH